MECGSHAAAFNVQSSSSRVHVSFVRRQAAPTLLLTPTTMTRVARWTIKLGVSPGETKISPAAAWYFIIFCTKNLHFVQKMGSFVLPEVLSTVKYRIA
jgi:hypothetical protein